MDLLAPCRNCLQCLPFFSLSPQPRVAAAGTPSSSLHPASKASPTDPAQTGQTLPSPPPAAPPAVQEQEQDLYHPPIQAEEETSAVKEDEYDVLPNSTDESYSAVTECEAVPTAGILIAPPVSSPTHGASPLEEAVEDDKATTIPEAPLRVPFINDITFSPSGFRPLEAAITPSPFGASYSAGQSPTNDQICLDQRVEQHGDENLCKSAHHEHDHSHHGHDHSHHGHMDSHDAGHVPQHSANVHAASDYEGPHPDEPQHSHAHAASDYEGPHPDEPQHSHAHTASDYEEPHPDSPQHSYVHAATNNGVPHLDPPLHDAEVQEDASSHSDSKHQSHVSTSVDDVEEASSGHTSLDVEIGDISPFPPLEVSQSTPNLKMEATPPLDASQSTPADLDMKVIVGGESSGASPTNGASAVLEAYHSEPVVLPVGPDDDDDEAQSELFEHIGSRLPARRRRRDHFRDQLKGFKQQVKQGGLHLKEEGNKHMQTIIENMNKQAQQIEQSGSFFMVPRANNN